MDGILWACLDAIFLAVVVVIVGAGEGRRRNRELVFHAFTLCFCTES